MKKEVVAREAKENNYILTTDDLAQLISPFFAKRGGKAIGKGLLKMLKIDQINKLHADHSHLSGAEMTSALLADPRINVKYKIHGAENLEQMTSLDAFFTISNHAYGGLDGIILIDIVSKIRPDFKVLVNGLLTRITALADSWIPVQPRVRKDTYVHDPTKNIYGLRMVVEQIKNGHPVGMFPAGGVPLWSKELKCPIEQPWQMPNMRIIRSSPVPIIPIAFEGNNSKRYYKIGERINYQVAATSLPSEILNKKGETIDVFIGKAIHPEEIQPLKDLKSIRKFVRRRTLELIPSYQGILDHI